MGSGGLVVRVVGIAAAGALAVGVAACGDSGTSDNLVAGKQLFVERCGACHVLGRAETKGTQGPNLDEAFRQALADGMNRSTVKGVVRQQILFPARVPRNSPAYMPAKLVEGERATDVAAYVAEVASRGGKDSGLLATAVKKAGGGAPAVARNGTLSIPADATGQLAFATNRARAEAGQLTIESENAATIPHNIALEGGGLNEVGDVVEKGGTSSIEVDVEAGEYTFYCSVEGHREGGMEGTLTVE